MSSAGGTFDPRPQFGAALDLVENQISALSPADLEKPTPCEEFNARILLAHLIAVLRKLDVVRRGGDMTSVPDPAEDLAGDEGGAFGQARTDVERGWASDSGLDEMYTLAWGRMTGRELLDAYTHEFTVHAWDLSRVTGDGDDLDPALADAALAWFTENVPADDRAPGGPFASVVQVPADANAYTRLAAFVGRPV